VSVERRSSAEEIFHVASEFGRKLRSSRILRNFIVSLKLEEGSGNSQN
jgi:hypothetical protein